MSILLIAGSPSECSRFAALLYAVRLPLELRGAQVERVLIRDPDVARIEKGGLNSEVQHTKN